MLTEHSIALYDEFERQLRHVRHQIMTTPTLEQIKALGPVPKDLGGFQNVCNGTVQLGDLHVTGPGNFRHIEWASRAVGARINSENSITSTSGTLFHTSIYRRMPVPKPTIDEATQKLIDDAKLWPGKLTTEELEAKLGIATIGYQQGPTGTKSFIPQDDTRRKESPMHRGLLGYFPGALFEVASHSLVSDRKHNPGNVDGPHWNRGKSSDHADCIVRHLIDSGTRGTPDRRYHLRALAWRALALLQEECEAEGAAPGVSSNFSLQPTTK